ncbi:hypothetical protein QQ008_15160 [Fulvivirgaceae bacterium BMA10]|uniref:Secreted protein n=1 Tax=Splendidivirga corallicola TaxID=3051826 RepID=A0ABT8KPR4_9BACT|nr:hypothetical protein [Fulvivirgaceae bacterium BMA10]
MKKHLRIGVIFIAVYFFMLPFVFAIHAAIHHEFSNRHQCQGDTIIVQEDINCEWCDLYYTQKIESQDSNILFFDNAFSDYYAQNITFTHGTADYQPPLRGPPSV